VNVRPGVCALHDRRKLLQPLSFLISITHPNSPVTQLAPQTQICPQQTKSPNWYWKGRCARQSSVSEPHNNSAFTKILAVQARAVFGPEHPVKTTFEVVISKEKNINTTKQSRMQLNGYTAHIIAYDQPGSFAHWKHVMSTNGGRSARDAFDELLDKLRERFSAVVSA
jgi:hypothetical protein